MSHGEHPPVSAYGPGFRNIEFATRPEVAAQIEAAEARSRGDVQNLATRMDALRDSNKVLVERVDAIDVNVSAIKSGQRPMIAYVEGQILRQQRQDEFRRDLGKKVVFVLLAATASAAAYYTGVKDIFSL